jgi:RNA polymerase sigma-70 factor, ECF subfamily
MAEEQRLPERTDFDRLYQEQGSRIRQFLRLSVRNSSVADDLMQETFLQIWRHPAAGDPKRGGATAYLLGIARKKAADWWRRNKSVRVAEAEPLGSKLDTFTIWDALNHLPEELRTLLWLREIEGYSYEELAGICNIPVGTVRSRLHTAREQLRTIWMEEAK